MQNVGFQSKLLKEKNYFAIPINSRQFVLIIVFFFLHIPHSSRCNFRSTSLRHHFRYHLNMMNKARANIRIFVTINTINDGKFRARRKRMRRK